MLSLYHGLRRKIDDSTPKPVHVHDTNYMVKKTDHLAAYFGPFEAHFVMDFNKKKVSTTKHTMECVNLIEKIS